MLLHVRVSVRRDSVVGVIMRLLFPLVIWSLVSHGTLVPVGDMYKSQCEKVRKQVLKVDKKAICVPIEVEREIT
jgi:hypothetical protein